MGLTPIQVLALYRKGDVYETVAVLTFCKSENVLMTSAKEKELHYKGKQLALQCDFFFFIIRYWSKVYLQKIIFFWEGKKDHCFQTQSKM